MAIIDRVGDWHSRTTGRYVEKPWTLGSKLFGMFGKTPPPPKVQELVSYSNTMEQEMTPDLSEAEVVTMGEHLGQLLDGATTEINGLNLDGDVDKLIEDYETAVFYLTTPRIWPVAPEPEEAPKVSNAGYRKVGSERRHSTRGVERVKNYTEEEKEALGIYDLSPENRAEFRRLRKDYLTDGIRQSATRASVFLEEVGALIAEVGADTPLGKELAKWQVVMRRRLGVHAEEEWALKNGDGSFALNTKTFEDALASLGDTGGVTAVQKLGAAGNKAALNEFKDQKIAALEKTSKALETFISSFDKFDNFLDESWKSEQDAADAASGESAPQDDGKTPEERSAAATKAAETRKANGADQWRAPEGTPEGGQFIDMPYKAISNVGGDGSQIKADLTAGNIAKAQQEAEAYLNKVDSALNALYSVSFAAKVTTMTASGGTVTKTKWEGPLGFEGKFTGDNRYIMPNGLDFSNVTFPQPFRWASEDIGAHDGARVIGTIQGIKRMQDGTIWGWGTFDMKSELGQDAQRHVEEELTAGVSLDLDRISAEVADHATLSAEIGNLADSVEDMNITVIRGARTRSATLVALPAFEGARIKCVENWSHVKQEKSEKLQLAMKKYGEASQKKQILAAWQAKFGSVPTKKETRVKELAMALRLNEPAAAKSITVRIPKKKA